MRSLSRCWKLVRLMVVLAYFLAGIAWTALGVLFAAGLVISAQVAGGGRGQRPA